MYKQRIAHFLSTILLLIAAAIAAVCYFIKNPLYTPAEYWLKEAIIIKDKYSKNYTAPH